MASDSDSTRSQQVRALALSGAEAPAKPLVGTPIEFNRRLVGRRFQVIGEIGSGGVGKVFDAIDLVTGQNVAIKVIHALRYTEDNLRRLRREANAAYRIKNPHLCRVQYLGVEHGTPYIVMERLVGETVAARLERVGAFPVADAVVIAMQLLEALTAVHARGYLHRDVKPGNIVLLDKPKDFVKLIDFGLVRSVRRPDIAPEDTATGTGLVPGTPAYLSPEQITGELVLDERIDVWATGVTLYEMMTGERLHRADSYLTLADEIVRGPAPARISQACPGAPAELDEVLARALAKRREERFPTAGDFRNALVAAWSQHRSSAVAAGQTLVRGAPPVTAALPGNRARTHE